MRSKNIGLYFFLFIVFSFSSGLTKAVTIDFDDLDEAISEEGYLTTEYESQGVLFESSAYLGVWASSQAITGPGFGFSFIDRLPVYVSFVLNDQFEMAIGVSANGPNDYAETIKTEGWIRGIDTELSTPYIPNQLITLKSDFGIASVYISGQSGAFYLDNLNFHYATEVVPEPHLFILFILGVAGIFIKRFNFFARKE